MHHLLMVRVNMQGKEILGISKIATIRIQSNIMMIWLQLMLVLTQLPTLQSLLVRVDGMSFDCRYFRTHGLGLLHMCFVLQLESLHTAWRYRQQWNNHRRPEMVIRNISTFEDETMF